ncbi:DNA-binding NarL/FixJ family response regulator [Nonomuraea angiospora]|uniref:DNA-binding NarL/FixJ family response regulator n=1 Tax=Nonomuraea angiospora TaxID=46172 RepID=A0ABR9LV63_9ACTN|nr:DNA-binding NarL/FixJ family response regulator [Nonomuraea angiospora]
MTTVVLADDEALLRKAMAALLPLEGEITVISNALSASTAANAAGSS